MLKIDDKNKPLYLKAKSIHMFAWSFYIKDNEKEFSEMDSFRKKLEEKGWVKKNIDFVNMEDDVEEEECRQAFMLQQYLSASGKNLFINDENDDCVIYEYGLNKDDNSKYYYRIVCKEKTYDLMIDSIELHLYKYGMGIIFIKTLNVDSNSTLQDIKTINDKGRAISIPFIPDNIPDNKDASILCPEKIAILKKSGNKEVELRATDFRKKINDYNQNKSEENRIKLLDDAEFMEYILNHNLSGNGSNNIKYEVFSDYRMFVISLIRDDVISSRLETSEWRDSVEGMKEIYALVHIDENDSSCQHEGMLAELLKDECYWRWADWGTLYGITEYSCVCVTSRTVKINSSVIRPFYAEYIYFVSLVLAQRMGLMMFSKEAEKKARLISNKKDGKLIVGNIYLPRIIGLILNKLKGNLIWSGDCKKIISIQEKYIEFQNSIMLLELSCQEQGIELYQLIKKQMYVDIEQDVLDKQLQGMYDVVNISNGTRLSLQSNILAIMAIIISIIAIILG